jgi:hypothetical protein
MTRSLKITKTGDTFCVDDPTLPGSPPVGYGTTIVSAIGSWLVNNQASLGIKFDTSEVVQTERRRQQRELAKR